MKINIQVEEMHRDMDGLGASILPECVILSKSLYLHKPRRPLNLSVWVFMEASLHKDYCFQSLAIGE